MDVGARLRPVEVKLRRLLHTDAPLAPEHRASVAVSFARVEHLIGTQTSDTTRLRVSAAALREALGIYTRERFPDQWADAQSELGDVLGDLALRLDSPTEVTSAALDAYDQALKVYTRDRSPYEWAAVVNNRGVAFGIRGDDAWWSGRHAEAVRDASLSLLMYRTSLSAGVPALGPPDRTAYEANLGSALLKLGERTEADAYIEQALSIDNHLVDTLSTNGLPSPGTYPMWARAQQGRGSALLHLGIRRGSPSLLADASNAFAYASSVYDESGNRGTEWAVAQSDLGHALTSLMEVEGDLAPFAHEAATAQEQALTVLTPSGTPRDWILAQIRLGEALTLQALWTDPAAPGPGAIALFDSSLRVHRRAAAIVSRTHNPVLWARLERGLGSTLLARGRREGQAGTLSSAVAALRGAVEEDAREPDQLERALAHYRLGQALEAFAGVAIGRIGAERRAEGGVQEIACAYQQATLHARAANAQALLKRISSDTRNSPKATLCAPWSSQTTSGR